MVDYKTLEKAVFEHLYAKHKADPNFTFSVRQSASKGAEADYFIGIERSNYFGFTLWDIPVGYPGAAMDLMDYVFMNKKGKWSVFFQLNHTRSPKGEQNEIALDFGKNLRKKFEEMPKQDFKFVPNPLTNKMEYFEVYPASGKYENERDLLAGLDDLMNLAIPIVDEEIQKIKAKHPDWVAGRYQKQKFDTLIQKLSERREKHGQSPIIKPKVYELAVSQNQRNIEFLPSNLILFGPPGTGKTYISKSLAVQIAENLSEDGLHVKYPTRDDINNAFKRLQKAEQIGFVTFHQSFSYEDFIEGIKPKMANEEDGESTGGAVTQKDDYLTYEIQDGIFKVMAERADSYQSFISHSDDLTFDKQIVSNLESKQFYKMSLGNTANEDEQVIYDYCLENDCIALGWGKAIDYSGVKEEKDIAKLLEDNGGAESSYEVFAVKCFILWMKIGDIVFISDGNRKARAIGVIDGEYYYDEKSPVYYRHFRKVKWLAKNVNIPVDKIYGKQFSQQTIYQMWPHLVKKEFFTEKLSREATPLNHVLIIDEINRGNIASIFGELITLIEEDKRKGGKEYFPATLPYSKKLFSVPSNLYIIGTMNTADRSVEALDTALRRRFEFWEMPPKPDLLKGSLSDIDLEALLSTINARIEKLMDKDHKIGHAYFMGIATSKEPLQELKRVFQHRILPLMQEYFYGDVGKIALVIGGGFFEENKNDVKFMTVGWYDAAELSERRVDKLRDVMDMKDEDFTNLVKAIYQ